MQDFKRQNSWEENDDFELLFRQEHAENKKLIATIAELKQTNEEYGRSIITRAKLCQELLEEIKQLNRDNKELNQTIIDNETMIIKMSKKIHLMQDYGSFDEEAMQSLDEQVNQG